MTEKLLELVVLTKDMKSGSVETRRVIDYNNRAHRLWLSKHCFWAFHNNRAVETFALADEIANKLANALEFVGGR